MDFHLNFYIFGFFQLAALSASLCCSASFLTLPVIRKSSSTTKKKETDNLSPDQKVYSSSLFCPQKITLFCLIILPKKYLIMFYLYGCLGEEKDQHCISQHHYLILVAKKLQYIPSSSAPALKQ